MEQLNNQIMVPLEAQSKAIRQECVSQAARFHVVSAFVDTCHSRLGQAVAIKNPAGMVPEPRYWTTRWVSEGVARK
jgi:hypothetical protein